MTIDGESFELMPGRYVYVTPESGATSLPAERTALHRRAGRRRARRQDLR